MYRDVVEINNRFGIEIVLCSNAETVCDGYEIETHDWQDATDLIVRAMRDAIYDRTGEFVDDNRTFRDWHGKHWDRCIGRVACRTLTREIEVDEDGDEEPSDWKWINFSDMPEDVRKTVDEILNVGDDAGIAAMIEAEKTFATDESE